MSHLPTLLRHAWNVTNQTIEDWLAIKAAANEAVESQLPGRGEWSGRRLPSFALGR
jgi:hypothetical protein